MTYAQWNAEIARRFFNELYGGKKVFLCVDDALLEEIGGSGGKTDFIAAIKAGPENAHRHGLSVCTQAKRTREEWRSDGAPGLPPYLAYLGFFVLAASPEGDYDSEGYHKRIHRLLGEAPSNQWLHNFGEMWALWDDLEGWANHEQSGRLGIVSCDFAGAWPHVGLPRAQIVLTARERTKLAELFADAELDPAAPPASEEMAQAVCKSGHGLLEARTLRRLGREGGTDEEMRSLTIEALLDELRSWDGAVTSAQGSSREFHTLRLNLRIRNRLTGIADSRIVVKDSPALIDDELILSASSGGSRYRMEEGGNGWMILCGDDLKNVNAATIDWEQGLRLSVSQMAFRLPPHRVRVLRKGEFDRIDGLIEVNRLDPYREFYVAAAGTCVNAVDEWGRRAGKNWQQIDLRDALPRGWRLFRADSADPAVSAPSEFPALRSDPLVRILLQGGLKIDGASRRYFDFAPPEICIEGLTPGAIVSLNDVPHPVDAGDAVLALPAFEFRPSNRVAVHFPNGDERSASFHIVPSNDISWRQPGKWQSREDGALREMADGGPRVNGAAVVGFEPPPIVIAPERAADVVGARPGQMIALPCEHLPADWTPVWLIERGRSHRRVIFCGGDLEHCVPSCEPVPDRKLVRDWKHLLWNERMRLAGPTRDPLAGLWRRFKEVAENV
jgi:hypothetical protein